MIRRAATRSLAPFPINSARTRVPASPDLHPMFTLYPQEVNEMFRNP